jgi:hypothetical protein
LAAKIAVGRAAPVSASSRLAALVHHPVESAVTEQDGLAAALGR